LALSLRLAGSVAGIALALPALAQEAPQTAQAQAATAATTTIEITGSRIRDPNAESPAPVTQVTAQELKFEGTTNVENLLNNLPSVAADQNSGVSNGSSGTANIDLRNLGAVRTLVLIDGRRLGPGDPAAIGGSAADVNFIPGPLVESVELLTGGASTDYGSDALAGVVNFKMKRNFEGAEIDQQFNFAQHNEDNKYLQGLETKAGDPVPGDAFDGFQRQSTVIIGANTPNGKGNVTIYATDLREDPVLQSARDYTACGIEHDSATTWKCFGSSNDRRFIGANYYDYTFSPTSNPGNTGAGKPNPGWVLAAQDGGAGPPFPHFNFAPYNYLQRDDQRYTAGGFSHLEVAPWADLYLDFGMSDDHTLAQIAPSGLFLAGGSSGLITINCANPFLSTAEQGIIGCKGNAGTASILMPGYRFADLPGLGSLPRIDDLRHTDYRFVTGSRGEIPDTDWTYDVGVQYFTAQLSESYANDVSGRKVNNALNVVNVNGVPTCQSVVDGTDPSCVPLNIFAGGGITRKALNYVVTPGFEEGSTAEMVAGGNVSGDLGAWGIKSPLAKDPVEAVFGYEYRTENLTLNTDTEFQTGDLLGQGTAVKPVNGSFDDNDFYAEAQIPVLQDVMLAKSLVLQTGIRVSEYDVNGTANTYSTDTWKFQGNWQVIDDFMLRGGYNRAARAPNTFELFQPSTVQNVGATDPCAPGGKATLAQCVASGLAPGQYHSPILNCPAGQCSEQIGGNLALKPETSDTWTWGVVMTPHILPNFIASVDYWDISIADYIQDNGILPGVTIGKCFSGTTSACGLIHRAPGSGIIYGTNGYIVAQNVNVNNVHTSGLDFKAGYKEDLAELGAPGLGSLNFSFVGTFTTDFTNSTFKNGNSYDCAGLYGELCGEPDPHWRHTFRTTWTTPWDADISVAWRHLGGVSLDSNQPNPSLNGNAGPVDYIDGHIGAQDYFDLAGTWQVNKVIELRAGINNILDKSPPVTDYSLGTGVITNNDNVFTNYDTLGRTLYFGINAKF
jgi:outer membrane receptor protein involved in Fe transport